MAASVTHTLAYLGLGRAPYVLYGSISGLHLGLSRAPYVLYGSISGLHLGLSRAPYVLYGVALIESCALCFAWTMGRC